MSDESNARILKEGDRFGDYTVEKLLGKGGMGAVYLAHASDGTRYAVKVMDADATQGKPDFHKRFIREGEFAVKIRHPNLIPVHCIGQDPRTGLCYLVMDYMPGGSLADRLIERKRFPVDEAVAIVAKIADALEVAHQHGVIHRDVKPDNIMFDADGTPKLADLGVAKFTDDAHKTTVTTTGMIIGTPAYMAPEQMTDSRHIDARADIYALGVVLYEMLAGKRPNEGSTAVELLVKAIKGETLPDVRTQRPDISASVAHALSLMCAPKPDERPVSALAAAELLHKAVSEQIENPPDEIVGGVGKARRKWPKEFIGSAFAVLFCMVLATMFLRTPPDDKDSTRNFHKASPHRAAEVTAQGKAYDSIEADLGEADFREKSLPSRAVTKVTERASQPSGGHREDVASTHMQKHVAASPRMTHPNRIRDVAADVKIASARDGATNKNATWRDRNERGQSATRSTSAQTAVLTPAAAADSVAKTNSRPRMLVLPFQTLTDSVTVFGNPIHLGDTCAMITEAINGELVRTRRFTMLDRSFSQETISELSRMPPEKKSAGDRRHLLQQLNTDYMVVGTLKIYSSPVASYNQLTGAPMQNDGPLLEVAYRLIVMPEGQLKNTATFVVPYSACRSNSVDKILTYGMSVGAQMVCDGIINTLYPMRVTSKTKFELVLNQDGMNIRVGEMLNVFRKGAMIMNMTTGVIYGGNVHQSIPHLMEIIQPLVHSPLALIQVQPLNGD